MLQSPLGLPLSKLVAGQGVQGLDLEVPTSGGVDLRDLLRSFEGLLGLASSVGSVAGGHQRRCLQHSPFLVDRVEIQDLRGQTQGLLGLALRVGLVAPGEQHLDPQLPRPCRIEGLGVGCVLQGPLGVAAVVGFVAQSDQRQPLQLAPLDPSRIDRQYRLGFVQRPVALPTRVGLVACGEEHLDLQLSRPLRVEFSHGIGVLQGLHGLSPGLGDVPQGLQGQHLQLSALVLGRIEPQSLLGVLQGQLGLLSLQVDLGDGVVGRVGEGR